VARNFSNLRHQMTPESQALVASRMEEIKRITALAQECDSSHKPAVWQCYA